MRPKKKNQFADVVDASLDGLLSEETAAPDKKDKPHNVVDKRLEKMNKLAEEKSSRRGTPATSVIRRYVKPSMCRMWDQHNRRYDLLNEHRCMDLITDVRAKGQQLPAIVRELHDDSEYIYEVVCGARRHWVAAFLGIDYFIEVRQMTDEEAFLLADSENRAREDISDYERGIDYSRALARYYKSVRQMAARYPYDSEDETIHSLRGSRDEVAEELGRELGERLDRAGVEIMEARLSHLAYAPEIAGSMLRRQQADAVIAARQKIVDGAVGMVEMALKNLKEHGIIELDEEKRAAMVSNLMVVLCSEQATQPVVNAGTLYG